VCPLEDVIAEVDIVVTATGNKNILMVAGLYTSLFTLHSALQRRACILTVTFSFLPGFCFFFLAFLRPLRETYRKIFCSQFAFIACRHALLLRCPALLFFFLLACSRRFPSAPA